MAQAYYYSSVAGQYTLTIAVTGSATILNINSTTGLPSSLPFKLVLEPGTVREEIVKVTSVGGLALTVIRGWDGSPATSHDAGVEIRHAMTAEDLTLARQHEAATSGIHGVTGDVVGTTDSQVISNKIISPATPSQVAALVKGLSGQSGDLIEFQDYLGNTLAKVDSAGNVTAPNLTAMKAALDATDATHTANIATNAANIASNTSAIATANSNIAANTANIATNTSGIATLNSKKPVYFKAASSMNLPSSVDSGVSAFSILAGGSVISVGTPDNITFTNAGIVQLHCLFYMPVAGQRRGWIDNHLAHGSLSSSSVVQDDRFSVSYTVQVTAGQSIPFGWRNDSGFTVNGCTCTVQGVFIPA